MEQPKEIEERFINDIVTTHMKIRRANKRLLVISTMASCFCFISILRNFTQGDWGWVAFNALLGSLNIFFARQAYRKII